MLGYDPRNALQTICKHVSLDFNASEICISLDRRLHRKDLLDGLDIASTECTEPAVKYVVANPKQYLVDAIADDMKKRFTIANSGYLNVVVKA